MRLSRYLFWQPKPKNLQSCAETEKALAPSQKQHPEDPTASLGLLTQCAWVTPHMKHCQRGSPTLAFWASSQLLSHFILHHTKAKPAWTDVQTAPFLERVPQLALPFSIHSGRLGDPGLLPAPYLDSWGPFSIGPPFAKGNDNTILGPVRLCLCLTCQGDQKTDKPPLKREECSGRAARNLRHREGSGGHRLKKGLQKRAGSRATQTLWQGTRSKAHPPSSTLGREQGTPAQAHGACRGSSTRFSRPSLPRAAWPGRVLWLRRAAPGGTRSAACRGAEPGSQRALPCRSLPRTHVRPHRAPAQALPLDSPSVPNGWRGAGEGEGGAGLTRRGAQRQHQHHQHQPHAAVPQPLSSKSERVFGSAVPAPAPAPARRKRKRKRARLRLLPG